MKLLVSVRNVAEARLAAAAGVDLVDLKEPAAGALGGLPVETIAEVVRMLRTEFRGLPVSATIGDLPPSQFDEVVRRVHAVAACGVDYVKVGIEPGPDAPALLHALADCGHAVVPVFLADAGLDEVLVASTAALGFPVLMVDAADKRAGSLLERLDAAALRRFIALAHEGGARAGLAGALRRSDVPALYELGPDIAGFRSAGCAGDRAGALDTAQLDGLTAAFDRPLLLVD